MDAGVQDLEAMTPGELAAFLADTDALSVTDLIRSLDDDALARLVDRDSFRSAGVVALLDRFEEFADPDRLARVAGTVCFDLGHAKGARERHTVTFADSPDSPVTRHEDEPPADVTIRAGILDFVRLVTGQANAALLYLSGRLTLEGDAMLALAVGSVFTVPGTGTAAVDPTALDPVDVATAVTGVPHAHLREVMGGAFRDLVLSETFRRFPEFLDAAKAEKLRVAVAFKIGGRDDGVVDRYLVQIDEGACTVVVEPGDEVRRDATLVLDGPEFLKLVTGQLNPIRGVLSGSLKVRGDKARALALNAVMSPPKAAAT